ncbi:MAG: hypothetical protein Tsb0013_13330 [Phycisphaerales bacterium]
MTPNQRKSAPALYELVGNGRPRPETTHIRPREVAPERQHEPAAPAPQLEGEITPGGSVRMPAGVIFLIVFGVFAALFAGYLIGYQQKAREVEDELAKARVESLELPRDPLNDRPVNRGLVQDRPIERTSPTPENGGTPDDRGDQQAGNQTPGVLSLIVEGGVQDPRVKGLNYLAITSLGAERVRGFLDYLADNRVDAAAYRVNNGVYRVYALRGFTREQYRSDSKAFQDAIQRLTEAYRDENGRDVKFSEFWDKF